VGHEFLLPEASVAIQVTGVVPNPKVDPDVGAQLAVTAGQLSEKVGLRLTMAPLELEQRTVVGAGHVMFGGWRSCTVTVAGQDAVAWSGLLSTTVRVTFVVPSVYGPAGDWVSVTPSPSGSNEPLLTDAFAVLHRLLSVGTRRPAAPSWLAAGEQEENGPSGRLLGGPPKRPFGVKTVSKKVMKLIFEDDTDNGWNRERALERLSSVTLPPGVSPQMGTDWSPVGQIYFFTLRSTNPQFDVMELKSIEDWVVEKNLKAVPNIVDVATFGGPTREYQVRIDPKKLISYGLSLAQIEQQLTNNNVNAGGSFVEAGLQQINVREVGLVQNVRDIESTVILTKNGTPLRVKDIATVSQGPKIRLGQFARAIPVRHRAAPSGSPIPGTRSTALCSDAA
jgi:hypothetical protein